MAFSGYKGTGSFDRSGQADAGSTILKLTNRILADLQVDNTSKTRTTQNDNALVRKSRSNSDPAAGAPAGAQRGPLPVYYDSRTILQPAKNPALVSAPISTSNELKDFDPLHSHSLPTEVSANGNWLSHGTPQDVDTTHVTSDLSKYLSENSKSDDNDEFWTYFDGGKQQSQTATTHHDNTVDTVANDNCAAAVVSADNNGNLTPQLKDTELTGSLNTDSHKCLEDEKDVTIELSPPVSIHNTEEDVSDYEDEQLTGNVNSSLMTKQPHSESKLFVARFIKLSPFKSINPELPRVKIIIVGDANTGKSCFLHKYIHGCFDYQSQPTVGVDICSLPLEDKKTGKQLVAQLWDTQGQERFNSLTTGYFRGAYGAIIVYDITNYKSLNSVYTWKVEVEKATSVNPFTHIPTVLVGNKLDLADKRETSDEKDVANKLDIDRCFETSSKDGRGIDEVVDYLLEEILRRNLLGSLVGEHSTERISLDRIDNVLDKKKCCK